MDLPTWDDPDFKGGTMVRAALWLMQEVGEGNAFTKEQLRLAFPGVTQADRRLRDLRDFQWSILASTEDASLVAEQQRFVRAGVPVWDPAARRAAAPQNAVTAKEKQATLIRDDHMCTICGISGGEPYPEDSTQTAVLSVSRRPTVLPDGTERLMLTTECKRCRAGADGSPARADEVLAAITSLDEDDRRRLHRWMTRGRRVHTPLDRAWNSYLRLPADARDDIRANLGT
ncbi:hypothetical protein [Actinoplanes palleronii]|uniref:HNH endonuclease n=1 Tax=Actinoplanes palleronii TaxID=113570 RepID=A0ABQ4BFQ1_9ACTN|nr:hypothetical protein [Actinoplanes palleronii]GIE69161.1 hypothetical protein Apa02nite_052690 [Actinoplanes palleronii]